MDRQFQNRSSQQNRGQGGGYRQDRPPLVSANDLESIIVQGNAQKMVEEAQKVGKGVLEKSKDGDKLTTSQIRAIFGEVRMLQGQLSFPEQKQKEQAFHRLYLLKPKLAYRAEKEKSEGVRDLVKVLDPALDLILKETDAAKREERFAHFVEFFEAILAYHKANGGK